MNIWIVNPFDGLPGESLRPGRYAFLARLLANGGHKVTWWSSDFHHTTKKFRSNDQTDTGTIENLQIILLKTPPYTENVSLGRIWNHYVLSREFKAQAEKRSPTPDVIIASTPPLLAADQVLAFARRCRAKTVIDVQDLWPEAFESLIPHPLSPIGRTLILPPIRRLADRIYDRADSITAVCNTMLERALSASRDKTKGIEVPLCVDMHRYRQCLDQRDVDVPCVKRDPNEFWAVYIGTISVSYDIHTIMQAANDLTAAYPDIRFIIAGDGPGLPDMRALAQRMNLSNVTFTGMLSYLRLTHLLSRCDVGMIAVVPGSRISMPNKLFDYMAAGLPLINSIEGELRNLLGEERIGLQYKAGDSKSLITALLQFHANAQDRTAMGAKARKLAEERFDMNQTYCRFEDLLLDLTNPRDR